MSDKDFKATSLQAMDIDLKITLQGSTLKIELPLSPTGRPNEMPFAAVDQQKKEDYLTRAENRLTDYLASQGFNNFRVDKLTGSGKTEAGTGGVKLELQSGAEANRIFSDKNFLGNLQKSFDQDRGKEYMKAAAAWTEGIGGTGGARVPYNGAVVKVEDTVAFDYYKKNFDRTPGYTFSSEKNEQLNSLNDKMFLRHGFGRRSSSDDAGLQPIASGNGVANAKDDNLVQRDKAVTTTPSPTSVDSLATKPIVDASSVSKPNDTINKNDIYKNDGAPFQFDRQNLQAAATTTPSPTLIEGNEAINKLFKQAIAGIENTNAPNKLDAAALAVQTISQAPGFKEGQDISVIQGNKGLIVSQGQGPAGVNMLVPQAEPGDFNKVSEQMTRSQPQQTQTRDVVAQELEQKQSVRAM